MRVSIDGPTASGKTTLAAALAERSGLVIFDSGLTYRALSLLVYEGASVKAAVAALGTRIEHLPRTGAEWDPVLVDGTDRSSELFAPSLDGQLTRVSRTPQVRDAITAYHRRVVAGMRHVVVVGRDIAWNVMPDARCHVYLSASLDERRRRRADQVAVGGHGSAHISDTSEQDVRTRDYVAASPRGICFETDRLTLKNEVERVLTSLAQAPSPAQEEQK